MTRRTVRSILVCVAGATLGLFLLCGAIGIGTQLSARLQPTPSMPAIAPTPVFYREFPTECPATAKELWLDIEPVLLTAVEGNSKLIKLMTAENEGRASQPDVLNEMTRVRQAWRHAYSTFCRYYPTDPELQEAMHKLREAAWKFDYLYTQKLNSLEGRPANLTQWLPQLTEVGKLLNEALYVFEARAPTKVP